jgi:hypothetical protein
MSLKTPAIPVPNRDNIIRCLEAIKETLEIREGRRADTDKRFISREELLELLEGDTVLTVYVSASHNHDSRYYTETELDAGQLDSRYYTETEVDTALTGKAGVSHSHNDLYYTETEVDNFLAGLSLSVLASVMANLQAGGGKSDIYTVPAGKKMIPLAVVVRNPTDSLAGGTNFNFGDGVNADTWKNTVDLSGMTATTDFMVIASNDAKYAVYDAGDVFGIMPVTGATADADATLELIGYLFDA